MFGIFAAIAEFERESVVNELCNEVYVTRGTLSDNVVPDGEAAGFLNYAKNLWFSFYYMCLLSLELFSSPSPSVASPKTAVPPKSRRANAVSIGWMAPSI